MTKHDTTDADVRAAEPSALVKIAAAAQAMAGGFIALCGLQLVGIRSYNYPIVGALPYVLMIGGVGLLALSTRVYRARMWAAVSACGLAPLLALVLVAWAIFSYGQILSCMLFCTLPLSFLASVIGLAALGSVRAAANARRRLAEQGMNLGL